jgi:hypothetical protein
MNSVDQSAHLYHDWHVPVIIGFTNLLQQMYSYDIDR